MDTLRANGKISRRIRQGLQLSIVTMYKYVLHAHYILQCQRLKFEQFVQDIVQTIMHLDIWHTCRGAGQCCVQLF